MLVDSPGTVVGEPRFPLLLQDAAITMTPINPRAATVFPTVAIQRRSRGARYSRYRSDSRLAGRRPDPVGSCRAAGSVHDGRARPDEAEGMTEAGHACDPDAATETIEEALRRRRAAIWGLPTGREYVRRRGPVRRAVGSGTWLLTRSTTAGIPIRSVASRSGTSSTGNRRVSFAAKASNKPIVDHSRSTRLRISPSKIATQPRLGKDEASSTRFRARRSPTTRRSGSPQPALASGTRGSESSV